jgi:hypothetical protein
MTTYDEGINYDAAIPYDGATDPVFSGFSGVDKRRMVRPPVVVGDPDEDEALLLIMLGLME